MDLKCFGSEYGHWCFIDKNNYKLVHQDGHNYLFVRKNFLDNLKGD